MTETIHKVLIASKQLVKEGVFRTTLPFVVLVDDDGLDTPDRLIFLTPDIQQEYNEVAHACGSGADDATHILTVGTISTVIQVLRRSKTEIIPPGTTLTLRPYVDKHTVLTGNMLDPLYASLMQIINTST